MRSILLLTDFSNHGDNAAAYGYDLAKELRLNVILCNAVVVPLQISEAGEIAWPMNGYDGVIEESDNELKRLKKHFENTEHTNGFHPQIICVNPTGRLKEVVANVKASYRPQMIVMGTHKKGIGHLLVENNGSNMINATNCPLLMVPPDISFSKFSKMAFATSFEYPEQDLEDISKVIPIANIFSSEIIVAHVHDVVKHKADRNIVDNELLEKVNNHTEFSNMRYRSLRNEQAVAGLELFCRDEMIGLLVMVHRPNDFIDIILKGSHTQKMAARINIPLLVLSDDTKSNS